jgi:hypothetical protein
VFLVPLGGLAGAALLTDGIYQVATGRRSLIPVERVFRKRVPASSADAMLQGAGKIVQVVGGLWMAVPAAMLVLIPVSDITSPSRWASLVLLVAPYGLAVLCFGAALLLSVRVNYVSSETGMPVPRF